MKLRGVTYLKKQTVGLILIVMIHCQLVTVNKAFAQDPQFTMYMFNNLYFNPAYAGTADFITGSLYYRNQWVSFPGAPVTQNLSVVVPFKRKHVGVGLNIVNDKIGITGNTSFNFNFAYYINVKNGLLSFGLSGGLLQYRVNGEEIITKDAGDQVFTSVYSSKVLPDFGFGIYYKKQKYYVGISATHLNGPGLNLNGSRTGSDTSSSLARNYYATGGYNIEVNEKFTLTPSFIARYTESRLVPYNFSSDIALKVEYIQMAWMGLSYRSTGALNMFLGFNLGKINPDIFKENIKIGYAYDITTSSLPTYNSGTHEIFISYEYAPKVKRMMPKFK